MENRLTSRLLWRANYIRKIVVPQLYLSSLLPKKIMSGPFKGMRYVNGSVGSVILPKLVGTYENELHEILRARNNVGYHRFIDVGSAEGYYVVGISKYIMPDVQETIAFEAQPKGRRLIRQLCELNNARNVEVKGFCSTEELNSLLDARKTFILVDIEGGEYHLLNPEIVNFKNCDLLVEIHKNGDDSAKDTLIKNFSATHDIMEIEKQDGKKLPESVQFSPSIKRNEDYVVNEFRSNSESWLFLKYKDNPA